MIWDHKATSSGCSVWDRWKAAAACLITVSPPPLVSLPSHHLLTSCHFVFLHHCCSIFFPSSLASTHLLQQLPNFFPSPLKIASQRQRERENKQERRPLVFTLCRVSVYERVTGFSVLLLIPASADWSPPQSAGRRLQRLLLARKLYGINLMESYRSEAWKHSSEPARAQTERSNTAAFIFIYFIKSCRE